MKESKGSQQRTDSVIVFRSSSPSPRALISLELNSRSVLSETLCYRYWPLKLQKIEKLERTSASDWKPALCLLAFPLLWQCWHRRRWQASGWLRWGRAAVGHSSGEPRDMGTGGTEHHLWVFSMCSYRKPDHSFQAVEGRLLSCYMGIRTE